MFSSLALQETVLAAAVAAVVVAVRARVAAATTTECAKSGLFTVGYEAAGARQKVEGSCFRAWRPPAY